MLLRLNDPKSFLLTPKYHISLSIDFEDYQNLSNQRKKAFEIGQLIKTQDSYVPAKIGIEDKSLRCKIRLKGDNMDHMFGDKWSLRVKIKDNLTLLGMNTFSLQHPKTRGF